MNLVLTHQSATCSSPVTIQLNMTENSFSNLLFFLVTEDEISTCSGFYHRILCFAFLYGTELPKTSIQATESYFRTKSIP